MQWTQVSERVTEDEYFMPFKGATKQRSLVLERQNELKKNVSESWLNADCMEQGQNTFTSITSPPFAAQPILDCI